MEAQKGRGENGFLPQLHLKLLPKTVFKKNKQNRFKKLT